MTRVAGVHISAVYTVALYLVVCVTWGTTWLAIGIAVETIPPLTSAGLRFVIAFPLFFLLAKLFKVSLMFPKGHLPLLIMVTILYFSFPYYLINYGGQYVSSGLTALVFSTMPVFVILLSVFVLKERITVIQVAGIILGFFSLAMILTYENIAIEYQAFFGVIAVAVAAIMHAFVYVYAKKNARDISVITFNTLPIGLAGVLLTINGILIEYPNPNGFSGRSIAALVYLGLVASVGGFIAYFFLLKRLSPVVLSFVFIIFPVIAIALDAWYENRSITIEYLGFALLMLLGFAMTKIATPNSLSKSAVRRRDEVAKS